MERCGKRNASNSGAESWTGIGVVASCGAVVLIMQWPYERHGNVTWGSALLQRLQKVRANCKTRNQLVCCRQNLITEAEGHYLFFRSGVHAWPSAICRTSAYAQHA